MDGHEQEGSGAHTRRCMRRAFTILEVLIVVLVIGLITAVVLPIAVSEIGRAGVNEARRQIESGLMLARSDAQQRGMVLRVWVRPMGAGNKNAGVRNPDVFEDEFEVVTEDVFTPDGKDENEAADAGVGRSAADAERVRGERLVLVLPRGVRVATSLPARFRAAAVRGVYEEEGSGTEAGGSDGASAEDARAAEVEEAVLLATCLPTGEVVGGAACFVFGKEGKAWSLRCGSWTGTIEAVSIVPAERFGESDDAAVEGPAPVREDGAGAVEQASDADAKKEGR